jgi:hypothetical protein
MQFRGFVGSVPTDLIQTILRIAQPEGWKEVFVACSGTFRTERCLLSVHPGMTVRSNDVSLFSNAVAEYALGRELPFRFVGDLAFIEDLKLPDYGARVAAVIVATSMGQYAVGRTNTFKEAHLRHYHNRFEHYVTETRAKLDRIRDELPITSYFPGDWLEHIEEAKRCGGGVIGYPPTFKGGYEKLFAFVSKNVEWQPPEYSIFDPATMPDVLEKLDQSDIPYFIYADQLIEGRKPVVEFNPKGKRTVYGYAHTERSGWLTSSTAQEPFAYEPVDISKLGPETKCRIVPASCRQLNFLRLAYLKKSILFAQGDAHMLVYLDDMLAGGIVFSLARQAFQPLEVMSDFSVTREGRIAKLVARLATTRAAVAVMERRMIERFQKVRTQAFSDHPVAMKYRGSYELTKRVEDDRQGAKYVLTYESEVRDDSPQEVYAHWWQRDGAKQVGDARDRAQTARPEEPEAPGSERPVYVAGAVQKTGNKRKDRRRAD